MNMKNWKFTGALLGAAAALTSFGVYAGFKTTDNVIIDATTYRGALGAVRNSAIAPEFIWCSASAPSATDPNDAFGPHVVECKATNASGVIKRCRSNNPALRDAVQGMRSDSHVVVTYQTVPGPGLGLDRCTDIVVQTGSQFAPKLQQP